MSRFGRERTPDRFLDVEGAALVDISSDRTGDQDARKGPFVTVSGRSSSDGSSLEDSADFGRPRRRRSWLARLLMSLRMRRRPRALEERVTLRALKPSRRRHISVRAGGVCLSILLAVLAIFGLIHLWNFAIGLGPVFWEDGIEDWFPSYGQPGQPGDGMDSYPTDFTRDVLPISCHSHNDYWRKRPLFDAIHYGCTSVEADVWTFADDPELYVGHHTASLTKNRTFLAMYVNPIKEILDKMNAKGDFEDRGRRGVFDEDPDQTLVLLIDFKNDGREIFRLVNEQLQVLRDGDYLTYWNGEEVVPRQVTVVGTGNTPFDMITANTTYRSIFYDAPLTELYEESQETAKKPGQGTVGVTASSKFDTSNSYYASTNFRLAIGTRFFQKFSKDQLRVLNGQVRGAHARGLKARYWGALSWPISQRNAIWNDLLDAGVDVLNADDLLSASKMDWRRKSDRERFS